jgi:hypothetical protein
VGIRRVAGYQLKANPSGAICEDFADESGIRSLSTLNKAKHSQQ